MNEVAFLSRNRKLATAGSIPLKHIEAWRKNINNFLLRRDWRKKMAKRC